MILSAKVSAVQDLIAVYQDAGRRVRTTPSISASPKPAWASKGIVASSAALGILLQEGIGDTIRISLTPEPGGDRTLRSSGRAGIAADHGLPHLRAAGCGLPRLRPHHLDHVPGTGALDPGFHPRRDAGLEDAGIPASTTLNVAVMGCIVNGPGESKHANIGISLPGTGEAPAAPVFVDGKKFRTLRGPTIAADFEALVIDYIDQRYGGGRQGAGDRGGVGELRGITRRIRRNAARSWSEAVQPGPLPDSRWLWTRLAWTRTLCGAIALPSGATMLPIKNDWENAHVFACPASRVRVIATPPATADALRDHRRRKTHPDHRRGNLRRRYRQARLGRRALQPADGRDPSRARRKPRDLLPRPAHQLRPASRLRPQVRRAACPSGGAQRGRTRR